MKKQTYLLILFGALFLFCLSHTNVQAETSDNEVSITISAAGDCTFGSDRISPASTNFYSVYRKVNDNSYFFSKVSSIFKKDDLTIVNLEGTLTNRGQRADKKYAFRGKPSYAKILKKGSIEAVAFANNHCRDYGEVSYQDTCSALKKNDIRYASYGKTGIYQTKGKKIGMVAVNALEGYSTSKNLIQSGIKKLKNKNVDLIIVSIHGGVEYNSQPNDTQKSLSHYAVQKGANLVLGHHPHVLQGIEKYKGAYIVYSLGNFCFGGNTNPSDKDTMIFQQKFIFKGNKLQKKNSTAKVIPCSLSSRSGVNNYQPKTVQGKRYQKILDRLAQYSRPLGTSFRKKKGKQTNILK